MWGLGMRLMINTHKRILIKHFVKWSSKNSGSHASAAFFACHMKSGDMGALEWGQVNRLKQLTLQQWSFSFRYQYILQGYAVNDSYHETEYKQPSNKYKWRLCGWLSDVIWALIYSLEMVCVLSCSKLLPPHLWNETEMGCKSFQLHPLPLCPEGPLQTMEQKRHEKLLRKFKVHWVYCPKNTDCWSNVSLIPRPLPDWEQG